MKAYLIDPHENAVVEVRHNGDFHDILEHIQADSMDAATLGVAGGVVVTVYVDDGGYYLPGQAWWRFDGYENPLPGRGLVVGTDYKGDTVAPPVDRAWIVERVQWLGRERPRLPPVVVRKGDGQEVVIDMNGPDAPQSREELSARINAVLGWFCVVFSVLGLGLAAATCHFSGYGGGGKRHAVDLHSSLKDAS